jgi:serine/threonine-protein kinase
MLDPKACRFWQAALQSSLLDEQALLACWDAIAPEKRQPEHIDRRLARQAVQTGLLTLWQAQQLVAGRSTGFKIDRYILLELIGQGGMGRVYLAKDSRLHRRVALKILSPERVNNPRAIARFHREAMVGAQLQHENLVRIYDEGEASGKCYLVMEYIEGRNIGQMIAETGPLPAPIATRLARQVALGLEHAQRKGLIHRDVNPYNILVTRDGTAKLTDMGLAIDLADSDRVTRDGATVGTFDYVSPEQARQSHGVDTRSDIYSLGCSLYHMLSGQVPFPTPSLPEKLLGHQASEPVSLSKLVRDLPPGLEAVVCKMIRKSPDKRYATPLEVAQALEPYSEDTAGSSDFVVSGQMLAGARAAPGKTHPNATAVTETVLERESALAPARAIGSPQTGASPTAVAVSAPSATAAPAPPVTVPASSSTGDGLFSLDLGPEPALSEGVGSPRSRSKSRTDLKVPPWTVPLAALKEAFADNRSLYLAGGATVVLVIMAAAAIFALGGNGGGPAAAGGTTQETNKTADAEGQPAKDATGKTDTPSIGAPRRPLPTGQQVAYVDADGKVTFERDLVNALRAAIGARGYVVLLNDTPLRIAAADTIVLSGGPVDIRAGVGHKPVVHVELKGNKSFLSTRGQTTLKIEGVAFEVNYVDPGPEPAPLFEAAWNVSLERCAFTLEKPVPGARALAMQGGSLTATGCWFDNFDCAIEAACYSGSSVTLRHCMLMQTKTGEAAGGAPSGWAIRVRSMPGGGQKSGRRLVMEQCTVCCQGFVNFDGFSPHGPATVTLTACAVRSEAMLVWSPEEPVGSSKPPPPAPPGRDALSWTGKHNQYDIRGKSWVLLAATGSPTAPMKDGPTDFESWAKLLGNERETVPPPIRFASDSPGLPEHPAPSDFAITEPGATPIGADPALVGPCAKLLSSAGR